MIPKSLVATAALVTTMGWTAAAHADKAAANACAANLTPDGKTIYAAVVAANPTADTLRSTMESQARSLVMGGKVSRATARDNAQAAGECVKLSFQ